MPYEELSMAVLRKWLDRVSTDEEASPCIIDSVFQYDNLTYPAQRKLVALGLASFVQTTNHVVLDHIDEIIGAWLSALGETEENDTGECVEQSYGDQDVPSNPWQQQQHTPPSSLPMTNPLGSSNGSARQESGSPTVSLSSRADPSSSFYSEASSSRSSSLDTAQTSVPPSPWDQMSADDTIVQHSTKQHWRGDDRGIAAAVAQSDFWARDTSGHPGAGNASDLWSTHADSQNPFSSSSITSPHSFDSDATPSLPQHSTFSHWQFVDFDPNSVNSTRAGHDDDGDHLFGPSYLDNSADCYYNTDEHDEEAILDNAWAGTGDGWGVQHETPIPEDQRLRAVSTLILIRIRLASTDTLPLTADSTRSAPYPQARNYHLQFFELYCRAERRYANLPCKLPRASQSRSHRTGGVSTMVDWRRAWRRLVLPRLSSTPLRDFPAVAKVVKIHDDGTILRVLYGQSKPSSTVLHMFWPNCLMKGSFCSQSLPCSILS